MEVKTTLIANVFTRKYRPEALLVTFLWLTLVYVASWINWQEGQIFAASFHRVYDLGEWWRAFTALLVHSDLAHLFSNTPLLGLFLFLIQGVFGGGLIVLSFLLMGLLNLIILFTMPSETFLLGASGVVHLLGALWLTLYLMLDRRDTFMSRWGSSLFLCLMLFLPSVYNPQVSYLSHALGFAGGILLGGVHALRQRRFYQGLEVYETHILPPIDFDWQEVSEV